MSENHSKRFKSSDPEFKKMSDVTFIVGPEKTRIPGFRQLLAFANPVFREMFFGKIKTENEIEMAELSSKEFKIFLDFLYFQEIDLDGCDPFEMHKIAAKFAVNSLCENCIKIFSGKICCQMKLSIL